MADLQGVVGKILSDEAFCDTLLADPEKTLNENGVEHTQEMVEAIQALDPGAMKKLAAAFGKEQAAY